MSRSGYIEDCEYVELYQSSVNRAINGKRGQAFLKELATAMDAMRGKFLIAGELIDSRGWCCAIGVVCKSRGIDTSRIDYSNPSRVGSAVNIARSMAAEIEFQNDQDFRAHGEPSDARWTRMRRWVAKHIKE